MDNYLKKREQSQIYNLVSRMQAKQKQENSICFGIAVQTLFDEVKTFSSCHELDINLLPIVK